MILVSIAGATKDSNSWDGKGIALNDLNKSDEAITAHNKAIEIDPQNSIARYNKGILCKQIE